MGTSQQLRLRIAMFRVARDAAKTSRILSVSCVACLSSLYLAGPVSVFTLPLFPCPLMLVASPKYDHHSPWAGSYDNAPRSAQSNCACASLAHPSRPFRSPLAMGRRLKPLSQAFGSEALALCFVGLRTWAPVTRNIGMLLLLVCVV